MGELLGEGSFGRVFKVTENQTGKVFACKQVYKNKATKTTMKLLEREVDILKHVEHEHIIHLKEVYETDSRMLLIMELCSGGELSDILNKRKEPFTEAETKIVIERLASALTYLHKNDMVHRDIKLENILVTQNPANSSDNLFIKVTDFGLSIVKSGVGQNNMLMDSCGTPLYMAPEIVEGNRAYSEKCDIWAMGIITLTLLAKRTPFQSTDGQSLLDEIRTLNVDRIMQRDPKTWSKISRAAKDCVKGMLNTDPAFRLTAGEVLEHPWLVGKPLEQYKSANILQLMQEVQSSDNRDGGTSPSSTSAAAGTASTSKTTTSSGGKRQQSPRRLDLDLLDFKVVSTGPSASSLLKVDEVNTQGQGQGKITLDVVTSPLASNARARSDNAVNDTLSAAAVKVAAVADTIPTSMSALVKAKSAQVHHQLLLDMEAFHIVTPPPRPVNLPAIHLPCPSHSPESACASTAVSVVYATSTLVNNQELCLLQATTSQLSTGLQTSAVRHHSSVDDHERLLDDGT